MKPSSSLNALCAYRVLDRDLAESYGVTTKRLNEQVKRNRDRFVVRAFVRPRSVLAARKEFARQLLEPPPQPKRRIGVVGQVPDLPWDFFTPSHLRGGV